MRHRVKSEFAHSFYVDPFETTESGTAIAGSNSSEGKSFSEYPPPRIVSVIA